MSNIDERILQFDYEWRKGDRILAKQIASDYINDNRSTLEPLLGGKSLEELVQMVSGYRDQHKETDRIVCDMWLQAEFEPQHISGAINIGPPVADYIAEVENIINESKGKGKGKK
jgi:hypothetical protein